MIVQKLNQNQQQWFEKNSNDYNTIVKYKAQSILLMVSPEDNICTFKDNTYTFVMLSDTNNIVECIYNPIGKMWRILDTEQSQQMYARSNSPIIQSISDSSFNTLKEALLIIDSKKRNFSIFRPN